ncbi:CbbQ/NirQ/NorQ/GpvN family protein [Candidatus Sumerlaeota bacterium]|nr:CbbQ/NirQ/NorQ/GpvN family protein [Candidatus Sumerlaeota bacterium]
MPSEKTKHIIDQFRIKKAPNYVPQGEEEHLTMFAFREKIPLILKGPTGCGKTRFVEYMAHKMKLPLVTVSCHEDLTAGDLVGRFLLMGEETVWHDGPLTLAVRHGGICYLDEIVEARKDTTVIIHSLTDDRRILYIDKTQEVVRAHDKFMMVMSYNPGYQNVMKDLKQSTKQRFATILFDHPQIDIEREIVESESGLDAATAQRLAEMGRKIRNLKNFGLEEGVSSRLLVYAARLIKAGMDPLNACRATITETLTDDAEVMTSIDDVIRVYFGEMVEEEASPAKGPKTSKQRPKTEEK